MTYAEKLERFRQIVEKNQQESLLRMCPDWKLPLPKAEIHIRKKYTLVDVDHSGRYMVENETGHIYGIKAYGVINRRHHYGTLDEIEKWQWDRYTAAKKIEQAS